MAIQTSIQSDNTAPVIVRRGGGASDADQVTYDSTKQTHTAGSVGAKLAELSQEVGGNGVPMSVVNGKVCITYSEE